MKADITGLWIEQATNTELPDDYWLPPQKGDKFRVDRVGQNGDGDLLRVHHYRERIPGQVETIELTFFENGGKEDPYNYIQTNVGSTVFKRYMVVNDETPDSLQTFIVDVNELAAKTKTKKQSKSAAGAKTDTEVQALAAKPKRPIGTLVWDCKKD